MFKTTLKSETNKTTTNTKTGAERIVELLKEFNVEYIFGYPGGTILPLYNALSDSCIRHVLCRHEQASAIAAEGYARVSGNCGVVLVTSGPGFSNTVTGIMDAYADKIPLIIIAGQVENLNNNEFQEVDTIEVAKKFTKVSFHIKSADETDKIISEAFYLANKLPKGPVVVSVTKSALEESISEFKPVRKKHEIKVEAPHSCVLQSIEMLQNADRPLIIVGGGCVDSECAVLELARITHIPVVNTFKGKGVADSISHGLIGLSGDEKLNNTITNADVVLALGTMFSNRTTNGVKRFLPNSKIININIEKNSSNNVRVTKELTGEVEVILQQIIGTIKAKNIRFNIKYNWIDSLACERDISDNNSSLAMAYVLSEIYNKVTKYNPIVSTDVGEHQVESINLFKISSSRRFLTSCGFGTMGFGLPSAIGAYFASPGTSIITITGDGSFQMNVQELATISEYNIPIKIFILNNSSLGMIESTQIKNYGKAYQSKLLNPDFRKLANAYGILSYSISTKEGLKSTLNEIFTYNKPVVIDINLSS